jgi:hypothetical protein
LSPWDDLVKRLANKVRRDRRRTVAAARPMR